MLENVMGYHGKANRMLVIKTCAVLSAVIAGLFLILRLVGRF
jgi:hypothetical protein